MSFNPPSKLMYRPPPLASRGKKPVRAVSGIIPNTGGLMFALPTYDEAGEQSPDLVRSRQPNDAGPRASFASKKGTGPKKVTNGKSKIKNTTVSISVPVVNFVESPLKDTSSIHRVSVQNKHKDLEKLPSWKEYDSSNNSNDRTHSDSMSNDSRNSTSDAEYASSPAPGNTRQTKNKKTRKKKKKVLLKKKTSPKSTTTRAKTTSKTKLVSGKKMRKKLRSSPKEGSKRSDAEPTTTAFEADDDECSDPNNYNNVDDERKTTSNTSSSGSISLSALAASANDEWYNDYAEGATEGKKEDINGKNDTKSTRMKTKHEQKKKREQMSREIIQRHAGVFQIDGQQQAQLHIDEVKESDPQRTVRIHRSGTVEIVTGGRNTSKSPDRNDGKSDKDSSDDEGDDDSYEVLQNFWKKRREVLNEIDLKFAKSFGRGRNKEEMTEADKWRQRFGIRPEWQEIPRREAFTIKDNIDNRIEDLFSSRFNGNENERKGIANNSTQAISKQIELKEENDTLKARLDLNEKKFEALEEEWKRTLETLAARSPRKSPTKRALLDNNSFKVLTPDDKKYRDRDFEKSKNELEEATTGWLRWLCECIKVKANQVNASSEGGSATSARMNRFQELAKFDTSSISDASSFDGKFGNNHNFDFAGNERSASPPPPLPPALQQSAIGPEAHALERACMSLMEAIQTKENLRKKLYRTMMQKSKSSTTKAKLEMEQQYNRVLDNLKEEHTSQLEEMQQKLQKNEEKLYIAETHSNERHHAEITKLKQKIEESEIKFKKVREIAKHDAEYELYQQRNELQKDHRRKYELLQEEVLKLKKENEVFRAREKDFDIRDLKEKLKATEVALAKTREQAEKYSLQARTLEESLNKQVQDVKVEARNAVNRAREEHTIRLNAMRNAHEEQLTLLKDKTMALKQDQELMIKRMQNENKKRMQEATRSARQEASRNITTARTEFEALAESKVTQMRALHRVEIQRLRRQLNQYKRSNRKRAGNGEDTGDYSDTREIEVDGTIAGLDGIEPSGIDLLNFQGSRIVSDVSSYGSSSGEDVPVDQMSINDMKDHIIQLRHLLSRAQKTIKKEVKAKKEVEVKLATAIRERDAAKRQARAWASASASSVPSTVPPKTVKFATAVPTAKADSEDKKKSKASSSSENEEVIEMDEDVTENVFLSPQGTVEKKKLQEELEDEFSLPSQDTADDVGEQQKPAAVAKLDQKPAAVAKLEQYLALH